MTIGTGPELEADRVRFTVVDPDRRFGTVRLYQEVHRPRNGPDFRYEDDRWICDFPRPDADRMEYLIEVARPDGSWETLRDESNPKLSPGAFGDKSVVEFPGYRPPAWTGSPPAPDGIERNILVPCRAIKRDVSGLLWSPPGDDGKEPLPLLVVHDGPEYAALAGLTAFFERSLDAGAIPRFRAALLAPRDRDEIYSASAGYALSLTHEILPAVAKIAPVLPGRDMRIGMGASLGALAMLHAHRRSPVSFGALYLQSGSYFRQRFDKQESGFVRFRRISRTVGQILATQEWVHPIPVTITCGTIEENLANNRAVAAALKRQGYEVKLVTNRDGHNWIGWRDTFDQHLVDLLNRMWG